MGINARSALHPRWVSHQIPVTDSFKTCQVIVKRRDLTKEIVYDRNTRTYNADAYTTVYTGTARLQPYGINYDVEIGNDPTARRLVLAQISGKNLGITNDDILEVTDTDNKTELAQYRFDVRGSLTSSLGWETNLVLEANLKVNP